MSVNDDTSLNEVRKNVLSRLNKIEGQIKGVKKMVEDQRDCQQILEQIASIRASVDSVSLVIVGCALQKKVQEQVDLGLPVDQVISESMKPFIKKHLFD